METFYYFKSVFPSVFPFETSVRHYRYVTMHQFIQRYQIPLGLHQMIIFVVHSLLS